MRGIAVSDDQYDYLKLRERLYDHFELTDEETTDIQGSLNFIESSWSPEQIFIFTMIAAFSRYKKQM